MLDFINFHCSTSSKLCKRRAYAECIQTLLLLNISLKMFCDLLLL